jgi:hypothetical protein
MEHPPYIPDLAANKFGVFPKINSALNRRRFQDIEDIKKCDNGTESFSTAEIPKIFPAVAASLGQVQSCSREVVGW